MILERFGWTYDYLMNGIPWADVQAMMADAPEFIPDNENNEGDRSSPKNKDGLKELPKPISKADKLSNTLNKFK